jgi:cytochrome c peroxidase
MKWTTFAFLLVAASGCKKKEEEAPASPGTGTATATAKGTGGMTQVEPVRPSQNPQQALPPLKLADDPLRDQKVALGHALFFDKRLSVDGSRACYSCHQNEDGNGGHDPLAIGPGDKVLPRHSPVIWNVAYFQGAFYWDGRSKSLEEQAMKAWTGGNMGVPEEKLGDKVVELAKIAGYKEMFEAAFPGKEPTADLAVQAIAEYERTLICKDTAYDKYVGGDKAAMSEAQQRGFDVFMGKGMCNTCHAPPYFSSAMGVEGGVFFNAGVGTDKEPVDEGRKKVSGNDGDWAAFKPPSLRNITRSAPYFHDGSAATLDDALKVMAGGGIKNPKLFPIFDQQKPLTPEEMADLKAFLGALDCPGKLEAPKLP